MKKAWMSVAVAVAASWAGVASAETVVIYGQEGPTYASLAVAQAKGFFKAAGAVDEIELRSAKTDEIIKALKEGRAQVGYIGSPGALKAHDESKNLVALDGQSRQGTSLYCHKSVFEGKEPVLQNLPSTVKISAPGLEAIQHYTLRAAAATNPAIKEPYKFDSQVVKMSHSEAYKRMTAPAGERTDADPSCADTSSPFDKKFAADPRFVLVLVSSSVKAQDMTGSAFLGSNPSFVLGVIDSNYCAASPRKLKNCVAIRKGNRMAHEWSGDEANQEEFARIYVDSPFVGKTKPDLATAKADLAAANFRNANGVYESTGGDVTKTVCSTTKGQTECNQVSTGKKYSKVLRTEAVTDLTSLAEYAKFMYRIGAISHIPTEEEFAPFNDGATSSGLPDSAAQARKWEGWLRDYNRKSDTILPAGVAPKVNK